MLQDAYALRIEAIEVLGEAASPRGMDVARLRALADAVDAETPRLARASIAEVYAAFAELLRISALLAQWRGAVLSAEADGGRFQLAARERARLWRNEYHDKTGAADLAKVCDRIIAVTDLTEAQAIALALAHVPMPVSVFRADPPPQLPPWAAGDEDDRVVPPPELAVAFIRFAIDGQPASETHFLTPFETHDLEIDVRVSRWPEGAEALELRPVSIEAESTYDFPVFRLVKPASQPPYSLSDRGRAILKSAQALQARPYEFRYAASFLPREIEQPVSVLGQRNLRIEGVDLRRTAITGYPELDRKVVALRDQIRARGLAGPEALGDLLTLLGPLANFAGRCVQDNLVQEAWSEARFQKTLRDELRRSTDIGHRLEEHAHAGGGETDLSFKGVRLELKAQSAKLMNLADCETYVDQTVSYVVASGMRVGVLCVLDSSPKSTAPFPVENGLDLVVRHQTSGSPVCIVTLLVQGNLAPPSSLSRRRRKPKVSGAVSPTTP